MARRPFVVLGVTVALVALTAAARPILGSSFLSAPPGVPVPFQTVPLPAVTSVFPRDGGARFNPGPLELVNGEHVITTDAQMRYVWNLLFDAPYDASLFDFSRDFVVFVGGGRAQQVGFAVTGVEQVVADYQAPLFRFPITDPFLAVTYTVSLPGAQPFPPPPFTWIVAAARVPRTYLDHVVFHRAVIAFP